MPAGDSGYRVDAVNRPIRLESVRSVDSLRPEDRNAAKIISFADG